MWLHTTTDGFTLLRLNRPSTALEWAPTPNDPPRLRHHPGYAERRRCHRHAGAPHRRRDPAKIASDRAKFKSSSRPKYENFSTRYNWGDDLPMVNALYLLDVLEALPGCTAACRPSELSCVHFHSPDGDALIMPIRKYTTHNSDEQGDLDEQEEQK